MPEALRAASLERKDTVENIQALRGIAALMVVWTHFQVTVPVPPHGWYMPFIRTGIGASGVDLFFVISGYVISLAACKRHHHPIDFLLARIARICPLYWIFVTAFVVGKAAVGNGMLPLGAIWNGYFFIPIFSWGDYQLPPGMLGWTLSFEMWFYLCFGFLLCFWPPRRVALILPLIFLVGVLAMPFLYHGEWYFPHFIFSPFVLEFSAGCLIFSMQSHLRSWFSWALLALGCGWFLIFSIYHNDLGVPWLKPADFHRCCERVFWMGIPMALIAAGFVGLERNRLLVMPKILVWFGTISYSMYLMHRVAMSACVEVLGRLGVHGMAVYLPVIPVAVVLISWMVWRFVEHPLTTRAQALVRAIERKAAPAAAPDRLRTPAYSPGES